MISDDKRREVAENLRHLDDETCALIDERMHRLTNEELAGNAVLNIGLCKAMYEAGFDTKTLGDFWDLLADLIDRPTCDDVGDDWTFRCSACGCGLDIRDVFEGEPTMWKDGAAQVPKFCPNCGANVVMTSD